MKAVAIKDEKGISFLQNQNSELTINLEISKLEEELSNNKIYKKIQQKKKELADIVMTKKMQEDWILNYLLDNKLEQIEVNFGTTKYEFKVSNKKSDELVEEKGFILDKMPGEFIDIKKTLKKAEVKKAIKETGVYYEGLKLIEKDNFKLKITNKKGE